MPAIDIHRQHRLGHAAARDLVEQIARGLAERYQAQSHWHGDVLHFQRAGVDGRIEIGADSIRVAARLGLLLAPLAGLIEREIAAELERRLDD